MYRFTADVLRQSLAAFESDLRTAPNANQIRQIVQNMATGYDDPFVVEKAALPAIELGRATGPGASSPTSRDAGFDAAVGDFIAECYASIDRHEAFEQRMSVNASLTTEECKGMVLQHMHDSDDWFVDEVLIQELALTEKQVHRAMNELEQFKLVEVRRSRSIESTLGDCVRLTVDGHMYLEGRPAMNDKPVGSGPTIHAGPHSMIYVGDHGTQSQTNYALPALSEELRAAVLAHDSGDADVVATYEQEVKAKKPTRPTLEKMIAVAGATANAVNNAPVIISQANDFVTSLGHTLTSLFP
jgi:hypothetical protein